MSRYGVSLRFPLKMSIAFAVRASKMVSRSVPDAFLGMAWAFSVASFLLYFFDFSHKGKSAKELKGFIADMVKSGNEEKLELAARILKAIYL